MNEIKCCQKCGEGITDNLEGMKYRIPCDVCPCHQSEKPAPEGWKLKTEIDDAAKKIMKITEVNDWPEGDLMEIDVRDLLKKLLATQKARILEEIGKI